MPGDARDPEISHPGGRLESDSGGGRGNMASGSHIATALRNAGKQAFLSVVKDTVELVALEAASEALLEETDRIEMVRQAELRERMSEGSKPYARSSASRDRDGFRSGTNDGDSASGSAFDGHSPANMNAQEATRNPSDRRRRRNRHASTSHGEGVTIVAAAAPLQERAGTGSNNAGGGEEAGSMSFRNTANSMEDDERETLLALLTGAYSQVNELTDELQISLAKQHEVEHQLKEFARSDSCSQLLPKAAGTQGDSESVDVAGTEEAGARSAQETKPVATFLKGLFPVDEGTRSTPANVRQLQVEVQRLRQRITHANSKEDKYRADLARSQRLMAVMESQLTNGGARGSSDSIAHLSSSSSPVPKRRSHTRSASADPKPLVDRVAELEEKLVNCSMENATAKQDHLAAKLRASQLEKNSQRLQHELARSQAMNDLLQNEIDRLQGTLSPEGETDGKGWRRWLGGLQEPLSPDTHPITVDGDSDSPVVVVRDLDNNQLVYAPSRSEFL